MLQAVSPRWLGALPGLETDRDEIPVVLAAGLEVRYLPGEDLADLGSRKGKLRCRPRRVAAWV